MTDGEEVLQFGTNPVNPDSDGDGFLDGDEIRAQTDPLVAATAVPVPATEAPANSTATATSIPPTETQTPAVAPTQTPLVIVVTATPLPTTIATETLAPTLTETIAPTEELPTATFTLEPTLEPTTEPTLEPTIEPTIELTATVTTESAESAGALVASTTFSLACNSLFTQDGNIDAEWGSSLISSEVSQPNGLNTLDVLMHRDDTNLYLGLRIVGATIQPDSKIDILLKNNSGGNPDAGDLLLTLTRSGVFSAQTGDGTNTAGAGWVKLENGANTIGLASNGADAANWQAELKIPAALVNALREPTFLIGVKADLISETISYPNGVDFELFNTQAVVTNPTCQ